MTLSLSNLEHGFVLKALGTRTRLDGRGVNNFREPRFVFDPSQRGHVQVHLGATKVLATLTASLARPYADRPAEGVVNFFVSLSSVTTLNMAGSLSETGSSGNDDEEAEATLQRLVDRFLKNARLVDTESLCIIPGERVWMLRVDLHVLDYDGALIDAVSAAALAALLDFRRPEVSIADDGLTVTVHSSFERHPVPLTLHNPSVAVTFALLDPEAAASDHATKLSGEILAVADPTAIEEALGGARLIMAMSGKGELTGIVKTGGDAVDLEVIQGECYFIARSRATAVINQINASIASTRARPK